MARIDHAAIRTKSYEESQHFFEVFAKIWRVLSGNSYLNHTVRPSALGRPAHHSHTTERIPIEAI